MDGIMKRTVWMSGLVLVVALIGCESDKKDAQKSKGPAGTTKTGTDTKGNKVAAPDVKTADGFALSVLNGYRAKNWKLLVSLCLPKDRKDPQLETYIKKSATKHFADSVPTKLLASARYGRRGNAVSAMAPFAKKGDEYFTIAMRMYDGHWRFMGIKSPSVSMFESMSTSALTAKDDVKALRDQENKKKLAIEEQHKQLVETRKQANEQMKQIMALQEQLRNAKNESDRQAAQIRLKELTKRVRDRRKQKRKLPVSDKCRNNPLCVK